MLFTTMNSTNNKNSFKYERLSPDNAAFLFVDHQTGLLPLVNDWSEVELKNNVTALAKLAKIYKMPIVLTISYEEGPNGPIAPGLKEMFPDVEIIKRQGEINAWDDSNFVKAVEATGRKKLIISGILTDVCVAFPTLSAIEAGYDVVAAIVGSGTLNQTIREAAISRMVQAKAQIMTCPIMAELQGDWKKSTAPDMIRLSTEHAIKYGLVVSSYVANKPDQTIVPKDFKA
jgi:nicotinamidase-related amidase